MKVSTLCVHALLALAAFGQMSWAQTARIPQITTAIGGRPAVVPQSYYDAAATEAADPNMHPSLGPFTVTAVKSGNWSDPTVWSTGALPGENATVDLGDHFVTYDIASTVKIKHIHNSHDGIFERAPGSVLWVSTQLFHGIYIEGQSDAPIPSSNPTRTIYWYSDAPGATVKYGLVCMGPARIHGEKKAHFLGAANNLMAGSTMIQLVDTSTSNWKVGDEICIAATEATTRATTDPTYVGPTSYDGSWNGSPGLQTQVQGFKTSQDEPRTITAINGDTVSLNAPLAYNHMVYSTTLPRGQSVTIRPYVVNFTRSIQHRAEVASTELQRRPHMMFMHNDDVDVRWVDILNFGRTSTDPSLYVPTASGGREVLLGTTNLADTNNVRGRYAIHVHSTGPYFGRKMVVLQGIVARGESGPAMTAIPVPGWGITQHNSRCAIEDCITYNVRGAGIVSELGNEIGQWVNNFSIWNRGDGFQTSWSSRQESHANHNGHMGAAYENQSRGILQHGNVAISSHYGWMFHQQNNNQLSRVTDKFSMRFKDPLTQGGKAGFVEGPYGLDGATYGIEQEQIHDFDDNTCVNVGTGFLVTHRQYTDRADQSVMIAKRFHSINSGIVEHVVNYTFYYSFYDSWWRGAVGSNGKGAAIGDNTFGMNWVNMRVENYATGFSDSGLGFNYNGFWIDIDFTNVATPFNNAKVYTTGTTDIPENHQFWNVMGPWTVTDPGTPNPGFTARVRTWSSLSSASLPVPYPLAPSGLGGVVPPGAATPSFTLDPTSDTSTTPTGYNTISLKGTIVDHVGVRKWPDGYTSAIHASNPAIGPHKNHSTTGIEMVETNGCFNDSGTWKCRLWFNLDERRDGDYLQFPIDITLTGFDPAFLAANVVDPNATKPDLPLKLESIELESIVPPTEAIIDNAAASGVTLIGAWSTSMSTAGYYDGDYLHDGNTLKGSKSVRFTPTLQAGSYEVFVRWTAYFNRATNVPYDITHAAGTTTVVKNQQTGGGAWVSLGTYNFNAGTSGSVLIRTTGTDGYVIADAVRFVPN